MDQEQFVYQPGVCNIDSAGVRWRRRLGYITVAAGVVSIAALFYLQFGPVFRFLICAGFTFAASVNFLQAKEHFCIANASMRTFEISLQRTKIADDLYKDLDLKKRRRLLLTSLIYAAIGGCLGLLPL
ncbi:MAG: hypothetical protein Q8916_00345 [Bacteroidota bacterium]|nr:hypothetical protein [Bacteroidota bacterium]MDP4228836.1 hypothetical protein [Bacteroidota bacterium]MDP4235132.1 hypothetical protein [Bacteroidota bacterium]